MKAKRRVHGHQPDRAAHADNRGKSAPHTGVGAHVACIRSTQRKEMGATQSSRGSHHKNMLGAYATCDV